MTTLPDGSVLHPVRPELHPIEEAISEIADEGVGKIPDTGLERAEATGDHLLREEVDEVLNGGSAVIGIEGIERRSRRVSVPGPCRRACPIPPWQ